MTIGVRPGVDGARSAPAASGGTVSCGRGRGAVGAGAVWPDVERRPAEGPRRQRADAHGARPQRNDRRAGSGDRRSPRLRPSQPSSHDRVWIATPVPAAAWTATIAGTRQRLAERRNEAERRRTPRTRAPRRRTGARQGRRRRAPSASAASVTTISRASLSLVPNSRTTKSLAPGGWRSITTWPIGVDQRCRARAARRRSPPDTPIPRAAAAMPARRGEAGDASAEAVDRSRHHRVAAA